MSQVRSGAGVGDTITLHGMEDGEVLAVTLTKVADPATPADEFAAPSAGKRLVGVQFRIANTGSVEFKDAVDNDVQLVDDRGQTYDPDLSDAIMEGQPFNAVRISPGERRLGFVVFTVPKTVRVAEVQFVPDSGFAADTGKWRLVTAAAPAPPTKTPSAVVHAYFDAINASDYRRAWELGGKNLSTSYSSFAAGFKDTAFDSVTIDATHGSVVTVSLDAQQTDGTDRTYSGTFTIHHGIITSAHLNRD